MTRVNLIPPYQLADQHLLAENHEISGMLGFYRKNMNKQYKQGHHLKRVVPYFHDKLLYIQKRFNAVQHEMRERNFNANVVIDFDVYDTSLMNDWEPTEKQVQDLIERIILRLHEKPDFYRYCGVIQPTEFFLHLMKL